MTRVKPQVAVIYTHFPHYRKGVFDALRASQKHDYHFFYDPHGVDETIRSADVRQADTHIQTYSFAGLMIQPGFARYCLSARFDAYIFLGNPYILSTWVYASLLRLRRGKVAFWTHGWLSPREGPKGAIRSLFYRLADVLLLYGSRAKEIGKSLGFPEDRMQVIYNSMNYNEQEAARRRQVGRPAEFSVPYFLCVSRLVADVQLELAIEAIATLVQVSKTGVKLVVVGDGPERERLRKLASEGQADVEFLGPIYDEDRLAGLFMNSLAVVSPGKVGLLAMHSLAYGTPVITHNNFEMQMPESEAIDHLKTGYLFRYGDLDGLVEGMSKYLSKGIIEDDRKRLIGVIENSYTPEAQLELIETSIEELLLRDCTL